MAAAGVFSSARLGVVIGGGEAQSGWIRPGQICARVRRQRCWALGCVGGGAGRAVVVWRIRRCWLSRGGVVAALQCGGALVRLRRLLLATWAAVVARVGRSLRLGAGWPWWRVAREAFSGSGRWARVCVRSGRLWQCGDRRFMVRLHSLAVRLRRLAVRRRRSRGASVA